MLWTAEKWKNVYKSNHKCFNTKVFRDNSSRLAPRLAPRDPRRDARRGARRNARRGARR